MSSRVSAEGRSRLALAYSCNDVLAPELCSKMSNPHIVANASQRNFLQIYGLPQQALCILRDVIFPRFFCGPNAKKSAALAKQQKKRPRAGDAQDDSDFEVEDEEEDEEDLKGKKGKKGAKSVSAKKGKQKGKHFTTGRHFYLSLFAMWKPQ